jgi:hypothetical protein
MNRNYWIILGLALVLLVSACGQSADDQFYQDVNRPLAMSACEEQIHKSPFGYTTVSFDPIKINGDIYTVSGQASNERTTVPFTCEWSAADHLEYEERVVHLVYGN